MKLRSISGITTSLLLCMLVSACAGTVNRVTPESERDRSGTYDGDWIAVVAKAASPQEIQEWSMTCSDWSDEFEVLISDGKVSVLQGDQVASTYVSTAGKFRLEIPTGYRVGASNASEAQMDNGNITLVLHGNLKHKTPQGQFVVGVAQFGNSGCTSKVKYKRA